MRIALTEIRRRPWRFLRAGAALVFLVLLLLSLGGLTDGLTLNANAALRAQKGDLVVFGADTKLSFIRSRLDPATVQAVRGVGGATEVADFAVALVGSKAEDTSATIPAAVLGTDGAVRGIDRPPGPGDAVVDSSYRDDHGMKVGDTLTLGPAALPVKVVGFVDDTKFLYQAGVWVSPETWRKVVASYRPDAVLTADEAQALVVTAADGSPGAVAALAERIDKATGGATETVTLSEAGLALPGVSQQASTFKGIIGITFLVVGLVVAMFFILLTIEHLPLYGVLKAVGASNGQVATGVVTQAVVVAVSSFAGGLLLALLVGRLLSSTTPFALQTSRMVSVGVGVVVVSVLGSLVSLRRVVKVDPVSVIG